MIPFTVAFAVESTNGTLCGGDSSLLFKQVKNVTIDSRSAGEGVLYVPVIGQVFDGHRFIPNAFENGALCTLSDRPLDSGVPYILVKDTTEALQRLSEEYLRVNRIPVIGITGSVGKTSTKEMLNTVLSCHFKTYHTPGNLNNQTGVPQAVFQIEKEHEVAILELGTNHPGEIRSLARIVRPDICVLTNIGVAHIEFFGSREGIFKGKTEMLEYMQEDGTVIANGDDDFLSTISGATLYGTGENCSVRAFNILDKGLSGIAFTVKINGEDTPFFVPAPGRHNVYNALASIAAGLTLGMTPAELQKGVSSYHALPGRMDIHFMDRFTVLDDSYNANPASMMSAIDVLKDASGRKVCILGDMRELGPESARFHYDIGRYAAEHGCDLLLCVGEYASDMAKGADSVAEGIAACFSSREQLEPSLDLLIQSGDSILVKASHGVHLDKTVEYLLDLAVK